MTKEPLDPDAIALVLAEATGDRRLSRREAQRLAARIRRLLDLPPDATPIDARLRADLTAAAELLDPRGAVGR
jgi:aminoglycoside phosphotransferase